MLVAVFALFWGCCAGRVHGYSGQLIGQSPIYGISYLSSRNESLCQDHLAELYDGIESLHPWALKVLDASGAPGPGFFWGNNFWIGNHLQCIDISNTKPLKISKGVETAPASLFDYPPFELGFNMVYFVHNSTMQQHTQLPFEWTIQLGLCTPLSCSPQDLVPLIQNYTASKFLTVQQTYSLHLNLTNIRSVETDASWLLKLPKTIILLTIMSIFVALAVIGTCLDAQACKPINSELAEILTCFSIRKNVEALFKITLPQGSISVIHGLKFFGMLWVVLAHGIFYEHDYMANIPYVYRISENLPSQILSNSTYSVDTFFFMSGFLMAYLFFKSTENTKKNQGLVLKVFKFWTMFLHRILRLTPPYVLVLLFADVMYSFYRKNAVLQTSEPVDLICPQYWWRNILYINNLYPRAEMCLSWSWYLSADTQFFAVGMLLLLLSTSFFPLAAGVTILLILVNILSASFISYKLGYIPTLDQQLVNLDAMYDLPWCRIGCYLIGIITAYIYVVKMNQKLELSKSLKLFLWCVFPIPNLLILFALYLNELSVEFSAIYIGVSRPLWGVGLGWLIIACSTGNARLLEKFLSFPAWIPFSRLTYCVYLLNPIVTTMLCLGSGTSFTASQAFLSTMALAVVVVTYIFALILTVLIEMPSMHLTKLMFKKLM